MRALVTGATGFIGSTLADRLVASGADVTCLVRNPSRLGFLGRNRLHLAVGDVCQSATLVEAVRHADVIFHVAGISRARTAGALYEVNTGGTKNVVAAIREHSGPATALIFVSSLAAAGPCAAVPGRLESDTPEPVSDYGRSKLLAEQAALELAPERPVTIMRPPIVYGPRDRSFLSMFRAVRAGIVPRPGRRSFPVSLVHVDDLVDGLMLGARSSAGGGRVYQVSDGIAHDWMDVGQAVAKAVQPHARHVAVPMALVAFAAAVNGGLAALGFPPAYLGPDKLRELRQVGWLCSGAKAVRELGFDARVRLEDGMAGLARWYRDVGWL